MEPEKTGVRSRAGDGAVPGRGLMIRCVYRFAWGYLGSHRRQGQGGGNRSLVGTCQKQLNTKKGAQAQTEKLAVQPLQHWIVPRVVTLSRPAATSAALGYMSSLLVTGELAYSVSRTAVVRDGLCD